MCASNALEMACACSVLSFAMMVKLLISYLLLEVRSLSESAKSSITAAAEAPERDPLGDNEDITSSAQTKTSRSNCEARANYEMECRRYACRRCASVAAKEG